MKISVLRILNVLALLLVFGCNHEVPNEEEFTLLHADRTGLNFNKILLENTYMNGFFYQYYYNGAGLASADFNNDGLVDIYFISSIRENRMFLNEGELRFKDVTKISGVKGKPGFPTGVTVVDINDDGLMDIYISKSGRIKEENQLRNELYINEGNDKYGVPIFKESASDYSLDLPHYSTQATFFDYDLDGDLDMFLINHGLDVPADAAIASGTEWSRCAQSCSCSTPRSHPVSSPRPCRCASTVQRRYFKAA